MWVVSAARRLCRVSTLDPIYLCSNYQYSTKTNYENDDKIRRKFDKNSIFPTILSQYETNQQSQSKELDWNEIKKSLILANIATESNVNSYILNQLSRTSWFDKADNFVDYLRSSKQSLNLGTVGSIFKCFYRMYESKDYKSVTIKDKFILELYSELKSKYKVLDHTTLEHCISALSCTKKWEECFDLLEKIKVLGSPSTFTFNSLAASSFKNNDPENGWKVLKEATYYDRQLYSSSYKAAIDYYIKEHNKDSKQLYVSIEKLLNFIIENNLSLDKVAAEEFSEVFVSHFRWASDSVHIDKSGKCPSCKRNLTHYSLTPDDTKKLKDAFFNDAMINKNVFMHSNPKEIADFLKFIDNYAPFDIVIDGLNVAYSIPKIKGPPVASKLLSAVVKNYLDSGKNRILVLGRDHMNKWKTKDMDYVKKYAMCYFVDNLSYDDTFLIYAALSGNLTDFMSRDLMRSHKHLLTEEKNLFNKWQHTHQHVLIHANLQGKVNIKKPLKYLILPQKQFNWHIPYSEDNSETENSYEKPTPWICLKPK